MRKAYANKKTKKERHEGDFYPTLTSLICAAKNMIERELCKDHVVFEPCSGDGA